MAELKAGECVDQFRIEDLIARGGMASIFRARDLQSGLPVALKIPHPENECDVIYFDRFRREQDICREMQHPGVVRTIEPEKRSRVYMAMEWVEGRSLRRELEESNRLDVGRAVSIAISVCEILDHIHKRGVVHRDLKPENIMLCATGEIKLLDFGIASKSGARRLTFGHFSRVMGTPDYIAPEQVRGRRGDARSDIYALGVILYEMLAGRTPFEGSNPFAVMNNRLLNSPAPLQDEVPDLPPGLERAIFRALARDPRERYASAAELAADLKNPIHALACDRVVPRKDNRLLRAWPLLAAVPAAVFALLLYVAMRQ
jgi:serine/threonine protein kinase